MSKNKFIKPTTAKERNKIKSKFYKKRINSKKWDKELELEKKLQEDFLKGKANG